jgi:hypothetical protein
MSPHKSTVEMSALDTRDSIRKYFAHVLSLLLQDQTSHLNGRGWGVKKVRRWGVGRKIRVPSKGKQNLKSWLNFVSGGMHYELRKFPSTLLGLFKAHL